MSKQVKLKAYDFKIIINIGEPQTEFRVFATSKTEAISLMIDISIAYNYLAYEFNKVNNSLKAKEQCYRYVEQYGSPEAVVIKEKEMIQLKLDMENKHVH